MAEYTKRASNRINRGSLLAGAFVIMFAGLCYQAYAIHRLGPSEPPIVATVDLTEVFGAVNLKTELESRLKAMADEFDTETQRMQQEAATLQADLDAFAPGSENYQKTEQELGRLASQIRAHLQFGQWRIEQDRAQGLKRIYNDIKTAAKVLAESRDYDIIIVDDSLGEIEGADEADINRQISGRRFLYAANQLDVSAELIEQMNK